MAKVRNVRRTEPMRWSKEKPRAIGGYWVRGYNGGARGLVELFYTDGELACNMHCTNTADLQSRFTDISYLADLSDEFEWCGPLFPYSKENS